MSWLCGLCNVKQFAWLLPIDSALQLKPPCAARWAALCRAAGQGSGVISPMCSWASLPPKLKPSWMLLNLVEAKHHASHRLTLSAKAPGDLSVAQSELKVTFWTGWRGRERGREREQRRAVGSPGDVTVCLEHAGEHVHNTVAINETAPATLRFHPKSFGYTLKHKCCNGSSLTSEDQTNMLKCSGEAEPRVKLCTVWMLMFCHHLKITDCSSQFMHLQRCNLKMSSRSKLWSQLCASGRSTKLFPHSRFLRWRLSKA